MPRFLVREIKYNKRGRRIGKFTPVQARTKVKAIRKVFGEGWEIEPVPRNYVRNLFKKR